MGAHESIALWSTILDFIVFALLYMYYLLQNFEFELFLQGKVLSALSEAGLFAGGGLIKDKVGCKQLLIDILVLLIAIGYLLCKYIITFIKINRFSSVVQRTAVHLLFGNSSLIGISTQVLKLFTN